MKALYDLGVKGLWISDTAAEQMTCPTCDAKPGQHCEDVFITHWARFYVWLTRVVEAKPYVQCTHISLEGVRCIHPKGHDDFIQHSFFDDHGYMDRVKTISKNEG